jgi:signal transduction histidine kinase
VNTILTLKLAQRALDAGGEGAELVAEALENAERGLQETREMAHGLNPRILSSGGLAPALDALARRSRIPVTFDLRIDARLPEHVEVTAYYVVSEALTNAAKHSNASGVEVAADATDGELRLSVSDDGRGGADLTRGSGLVGLKDRVEAIGGTLTIQSSPGQGTRLNIEIPVNADIPASPS